MRARCGARRALAALALGLSLAQGAWAQPVDEVGPYIGVLESDGAPIYASFAPASGPLVRQAGQPGAWYAVLQWPMAPGQAYRLQLNAPDDGGRLRVSAFDDDPYGNPTVRADVAVRLLGPRARRRANWGATVRIPAQASQAGVWLLIEWVPPAAAAPASAPPWVRLQAYAVDAAALAARTPRWGAAKARVEIPASPLAGPAAVQELPLPSAIDPLRR